jgi:hypothetical protein
MGIGDEIFNAESVTLVVGVLHPNHDGVKEHKDAKNDFRPGYTRTGVYNMIFASKDNSVVLHLQVSAYWRFYSIILHKQHLSSKIFSIWKLKDHSKFSESMWRPCSPPFILSNEMCQED